MNNLNMCRHHSFSFHNKKKTTLWTPFCCCCSIVWSGFLYKFFLHPMVNFFFFWQENTCSNILRVTAYEKSENKNCYTKKEIKVQHAIKIHLSHTLGRLNWSQATLRRNLSRKKMEWERKYKNNNNKRW